MRLRRQGFLDRELPEPASKTFAKHGPRVTASGACKEFQLAAVGPTSCPKPVTIRLGIPPARSSPEPTRGHSHRWTPESHVRGSSLRILRRPTLVGGQATAISHLLTVSENASNRKSLQNFPRRNDRSGRKKDRHPLVQCRWSARPARFDLRPMRHPTALGERFVAEDG